MVESGEFPFMVALGYVDKSNLTTYRCAGVLISDTWVLTTAHCIIKSIAYVRVGSVSIKKKNIFKILIFTSIWSGES